LMARRSRGTWGTTCGSDVIRPRLSRGAASRAPRGSADRRRPGWSGCSRAAATPSSPDICARRGWQIRIPRHIRARLYVEQIAFNVRMIVWASDHLHRCCRERGFEDVLFMTRDGCLWQHWFNRRHPGCRHRGAALEPQRLAGSVARLRRLSDAPLPAGPLRRHIWHATHHPAGLPGGERGR
jgi:hypothetical protein